MHRNDSPHQLQYFLRERTKELTALHKTARLMQDDSRPIVELLTEVVNLLPPAWQYPEVTVARIAVNGFDVTTRDFDRSAWMMTAPIQFVGGAAGLIEVGYVEERSPAVEGPFLAEERELLDSLADMLRNYLQYRMAIEEIKKSNDNLERLVLERTLELSNTNVALQLQIQEHEKHVERLSPTRNNFANWRLNFRFLRRETVALLHPIFMTILDRRWHSFE